MGGVFSSVFERVSLEEFEKVWPAEKVEATTSCFFTFLFLKQSISFNSFTNIFFTTSIFATGRYCTKHMTSTLNLFQQEEVTLREAARFITRLTNCSSSTASSCMLSFNTSKVTRKDVLEVCWFLLMIVVVWCCCLKEFLMET